MNISNQTLLIIVISVGIFLAILIVAANLLPAIRSLFKKTKYKKMGSSSQFRLIHQIDEAVQHLSKMKIGAIITIENKRSLDHLRTDGIIVDANISSSLIISIFNKNSPLHDGAIIIRESKIKYAATYFKITQSSVANKYGARHRAAMGIAEQSDSVTIVVSEETGKVSIWNHGRMIDVSMENFQSKLVDALKEVK